MEIKIRSASELRDMIIFLEEKKRQQKMAMHEELESTFESLRSVNLLKSALHNILQTGERSSVLPAIAGLIGSSLVKKTLPGKSVGLLKKVLGATVGWGINRWILNKTEKKDQ